MNGVGVVKISIELYRCSSEIYVLDMATHRMNQGVKPTSNDHQFRSVIVIFYSFISYITTL